jgi:hypothetical protein
MLTRNLKNTTWVLGVIVILCSYNLAFGDVSTKETVVTPPVTEQINNLNHGDVSKPRKNETANESTSASKKSVPIGKPSAAPTKACACTCTSSTAPTRPTAGWWSCVRGCLRDAGVSLVQVILCGAACATGNIPICAICIGVDVTVLMACAIGCDVYAEGGNHGDGGFEPILVRNSPQKNGSRASRRVPAFVSLK